MLLYAAPVPANNDNQILEHCLIFAWAELNIIASMIVVDRRETEVATSGSRILMNIELSNSNWIV